MSFFWNRSSSSCISSSKCLGSTSELNAIWPCDLSDDLVWTRSIGSPMIWLFWMVSSHHVSSEFPYFFLRTIHILSERYYFWTLTGWHLTLIPSSSLRFAKDSSISDKSLLGSVSLNFTWIASSTTKVIKL